MTASMRLLRHRSNKGADLSARDRDALVGFNASTAGKLLARHLPEQPARRQSSPSPAAIVPAPAKLPADTQRDVPVAAIAAKSQARARVDAVFASPHAKGRERGCTILLGHANNWSAAEIIKQLPHLKTDAELGYQVQTEQSARAARADVIWGTAYDQSAVDSQLPGLATSIGANARPAQTDDPWAKAFAVPDSQPTSGQPTVKADEADLVWTRKGPTHSCIVTPG